MSRRFSTFAIVGVIGFVIQLAALAVLMEIGHWSWLPATIVAVECAIVHNYAWHELWTWRDRRTAFAKLAKFAGFAGFVRFVRFNASTALTSITGNVILMALFVGVLGLPAILANMLAVGIVSIANFVLADRWVFVPLVAPIVLLTATAASAGVPDETLAAWNQYVDRFERQLVSTHETRPRWQPTGIEADGSTIPISGGTISDWRGAVFVAGTTVDRVLDRLQHPGTPPPQEDVVASRVLGRAPSSLRVYMRLVRSAIVTVTYDTEHEMTFSRWSRALATARSVSTRIEEVGGGDRGFLWRLNSYWRYEQVGNGVLISVECLTLSRNVPTVLKPVAGRIVPRIARDSLYRTLEAVRQYTH